MLLARFPHSVRTNVHVGHATLWSWWWWRQSSWYWLHFWLFYLFIYSSFLPSSLVLLVSLDPRSLIPSYQSSHSTPFWSFSVRLSSSPIVWWAPSFGHCNLYFSISAGQFWLHPKALSHSLFSLSLIPSSSSFYFYVDPLYRPNVRD